jgi:hypothetical protein
LNIWRHGDCSRESNVRTSVSRNTKSLIKLQRRYRTQYVRDPPSDNSVTSSMNWSSELLLRSKQLHRKCWRTLEGKLNTDWISYVPRKASILQRWFYN